MGKLLSLAFVCLLLTGCFEDGAKAKLAGLGYTKIDHIEQSFFIPGGWKCGRGNKYEFHATNPQGKRVTGTLCYPNFLDVVHEEPI